MTSQGPASVVNCKGKGFIVLAEIMDAEGKNRRASTEHSATEATPAIAS